MAQPRFPQSYENVPVRKALTALAAEPTLENLDALLATAVKGALVVDVTGSTPQDTRLRTISSTTGEAVLPLFTSMNALRAAVAQSAEGEGARVQAVIVPALEALGFIRTAEFVAVQFDPGAAHTMVVARSHIESALGER
ncbi:SseB protein N-terminal domain-containing protein [Leifsonia sp. 98AMF]|uniref:SseB family protein n=1 Tax=unclassified Leifsonia TaxID=2663824 RepID=UPI00087A5BC2|nr:MULTISPECIES: SseB family protein [unclassified Leifsonia]SDH00876.1 SseB protein N-terminal domain-containing protein [Leifsonia sp. 197AMF]SDJ40569.1 SseB protein N-terminal domain-containing protein [Leifsonia sp. 466MF]SDK37174.1 SseB protein N-terminal domain-containing protein [Leifsonia sp. 157MF]SDN60808.1 SseB protein N-terminal domain-containing protein [Leifsonia sp. 509MF]SEN48271.1 SseB protein N-terminal domain-containing protein [Leifsonia sp. 467MF]